MALFPDLMPPAADIEQSHASSLDTRKQLHPIPTSQTPPETVSDRRRVLLPPREHRSRKDPDEYASEAASRLRLNRDAADAIRGTLQLGAFDIPAHLRVLLDEEVVRAHMRRMPGGELLEVPAKTGATWLWEQAMAIDGCDEVLAFREAQCGTSFIRPNSCKTRVCGNCERARSAQLVRIYEAILGDVSKRRRSMVVLTVRNTPELAPALDDIARSVRSLRGRAIFRGGRCRWRQRDGKPGHVCGSRFCSRWSDGGHRRDRNCPDFVHLPVIGGVGTTEVTFNVERRTWHPHVNLLLDAPFIEQAELADTWRAVTCSDRKHRRAGWCPGECDAGSGVVWIRQVDPGSVREAIKYVTKASDLVEGDDPLQIAEFLLATRGRRMVQGFGSFFGVDLEEVDDEEMVTLTVIVEGMHDAAGQPVVRRHRLPRFCRYCERDTKIDDDTCTYELPINVPRGQVRLRNGSPSWRPPAPGVDRLAVHT